MAQTHFITYQLHIMIAQETTIDIGKLGKFTFPAGKYIYTGSAKRNIEARIARHLSHHKTLKWHINYLLATKQASISQVERFQEAECTITQRTAGKIIVNKFGASDCHQGCGSHLKFLA